MTSSDLYKTIEYIANKCNDLKDKYIDEDLKIDYVCIFSQSQEEYEKLLDAAHNIGSIVDETSTGPVFKFNNLRKTIIGSPKVLKIRIPEKTRTERGDVDFITDYENFKNKYFDNNRFKLIKRERFEMLELKDPEFNIIAYFSSIPPSKLLL